MTQPKLRSRSSGFGGSGYRIPTWLDDAGKPMLVPSVTTITGVTHKPGLQQWIADQTAAYAVTNIDALMSRTEEAGWGFLRYFWKREPKSVDELRGAHRRVLNEAADIGTNVHEWIEADLRGEFEPAIDSFECEQMVEQWLQWKSEHTIDPVLVEATAVNREHGYAGTLDGVWIIDGVPTLVDVKTSRNTWPEHFQQLAALGACYSVMEEVAEDAEGAVAYADTWWVERVMPAFSEYAILHLRPQDVDNKGNQMDSFCTLKPVGNIDLHFEGFLGALQIKKYERKLKEMEG
jgi:hypothetical protein